MGIHAPVFLKGMDRGEIGNEFTMAVKDDILATIEFLYKRGMWSKFHYEKWKAEATKSTDDVFLHGWWDAIVGGAMFEMDLEDLKEYESEGDEDTVDGGSEEEGLAMAISKKGK